MKSVTVTRHFQAPQDKVFSAFSDFPRAPDRIKGIKKVEMLTSGPVAKGTRFRETRVMFGKEATEEMEVTAFSPPQGYTLGCTSCGCRYESAFKFRPAQGGTDVEMTFKAEPLTLFAKIMGKVMGPMMSGTIKKCIESDMDSLKQYCENNRA